MHSRSVPLTNGAYIVAPLGPRLSPDEARFFRDADPWGFILFARNIETPGQVRALTAELRDAVGREAAIFIDQEGGRVQRLCPPTWRGWLPPLDQIERTGGIGAERGMWLRYRIIAAELRDLGIDGNCAPCADVASDATHPFLRNRCYGTDPAEVVRMSAAVSDALLAGGVLPVLKHIPGHGRATVDSHLGLPRVDAPAVTLLGQDFSVFHALRDIPLAMTAHVIYSAFDGVAATLSEPMIRLIREEIGYEGLLMTDDISMGALSGSIAERSRVSMAAGCDLVLHCNGDPGEMLEMAEATGQMSEKGQSRADAALSQRRAPEPFDLPEAEAELAALIRGEAHA